MRTFHIGGAAARGKIEQSSIETRFGGIVKFDNAKRSPSATAPSSS